MDMSAWVVYSCIAALIIAASVLHYRWREPDGRGRVALGLLRGVAVALIVLLLFDPAVPAAGGGPGRPVVAVVDASLSMSRSNEAGSSRWETAAREVAALAPDRILLFGDEPTPVAALPDTLPGAPRSRLGPALRSALEAGPARVVVVTDGAIEDAADAGATAAAAPSPVEVRTLGEEARANVAVHAVRAPSWMEVGAPTDVGVSVRVASRGGPALPDSAAVTVSRGDRVLARGRVALPPAGRSADATLTVRPDSGSDAPVRLDVAVSPGGAESADDVRSVYVRIAEEPAGVALVSFRPDQEPRFLLPVLERALGVPARGWLALPGDRFIGVGSGDRAGRLADEAGVRAAVADAGLVVLHGLSAEAPGWALDALASAERAVVFPAAPAPPLPVEVGAPRSGEWYLDPELPTSPLAALLVGLDAGPIPPLEDLRPMGAASGYWAPLLARRGRRGEAAPVLVAGGEDGRRLAVALGEGYWRWAFAGGAAREAYDRMWSAVGGWLMEDAADVERSAIRPLERVVPRGAPVRWVAPGDSVRLVIRAGEGAAGDSAGAAAVLDTLLAVRGGRAASGVLPPGHYRYEAPAAGGASAEGAFTVVSYSPELSAEAAALELEGGDGGGVDGWVAGSTPLRSVAWPYVLIVAMLCLEWALRRRWGLR